MIASLRRRGWKLLGWVGRAFGKRIGLEPMPAVLSCAVSFIY